MSGYTKPEFVRGQSILKGVFDREGDGMVCTMPEPWELVRAQTDFTPSTLHTVTDMALETLEALEPTLPDCRVVYGIGGGSSADTAKYVAMKKGCRLVQIPTIVSVDAPLTDAVGVRIDGKVRYIGKVWPDLVAVDYDVIRQAPAHLNRAGCGDLLSIHTALYDWQLAGVAGEIVFDQSIADQARACLTRVIEQADEIGNVSQAGIDAIVDEYCEEIRLCVEFGGSRPEEGSEHLFAYNYEYLTGKHMAHGELVGTGIYAMAVVQDNDPEGIRQAMERCRLRYRPADNGMTRAELAETLRTLNAFRRNHPDDTFYSVLDRTEITEEMIERIVADLC